MVSFEYYKKLEEAWNDALPSLVNRHPGRFALIEELDTVRVYDSRSEISDYLKAKYPEAICGPTWFIEEIPNKLPHDHPSIPTYRSRVRGEVIDIKDLPKVLKNLK